MEEMPKVYLILETTYNFDGEDSNGSTNKLHQLFYNRVFKGIDEAFRILDKHVSIQTKSNNAVNLTEDEIKEINYYYKEVVASPTRKSFKLNNKAHCYVIREVVLVED